jgi:hypothetical protein
LTFILKILRQKFGRGAIPPPSPSVLLLFQTTRRWETSTRPMVCSLAQRQSGFQLVTCPERYRVQGAASKGGRATLKMLRRKSKTQYVNQERNMQNATELLNYLKCIAQQQCVRYTRESLPLHPPIRRIFSFNQNK